MSKRKVEDDSEESISESELSADSDSAYEERKPKTRRPRKHPSPRKARETKLPTKASIVSLATDGPVHQGDVKERLDNVDSVIIGRIKKALTLAQHEGTGEDEARAALRMAAKLLEKHNITQAEVMAQENEEEKLKRAGMSVVKIQSTAEVPKAVMLEQWSAELGSAINIFFDCQHYTTTYGDRSRITFHFYGLAEQTVAAVHAFEMAYNLILTWSLGKTSVKGRHAKNAYRLGVTNGLWGLAKKEKKEEEQKAIQREANLLIERQKQEAEEDRSRMERLTHPAVKDEVDSVSVKDEPAETKVKLEEMEDEDMVFPRKNRTTLSFNDNADHSADDDSGDEGFDVRGDSEFVQADFRDDDPVDLLDLDALAPKLRQHSEEAPKFSPSEEKVPKAEPADEALGWNSQAQLIAFRESTVAIGNDYLKSQGVKLEKGRSRKAFEFKDSAAYLSYNQGKKDAKKIDVKRRRIKGPDDD